MKLVIDTEQQTLQYETKDGEAATIPLYSREGFERLSQLWLKVGWNQKYTYTFSWLGRPIIQLPDDMIRLQEAIYRVKPDVILETGIAHGGSLVYSASLCQAIGKGRVIGVDIEIRPHNRQAIEAHELFPRIELIEGDSTDPDIVQQVQALIQPNDSVLVILDSCHTKQHVTAELQAYAPLVTLGSYLVVTDGFMQDLADVPRGRAEWSYDNPAAAAVEFARDRADFVLETPPWPFNESELQQNVTHWPQAWLKRVA